MNNAGFKFVGTQPVIVTSISEGPRKYFEVRKQESENKKLNIHGACYFLSYPIGLQIYPYYNNIGVFSF